MTAFVALTLGSLWLFNAAALSEAKEEAGHLGEVTARVAMAPFLTPGLRTGQPADLARMDQAGKAFIATGNVGLLKIWSREGQVLWADDERLRGQFFTLQQDEIDLFSTGGVLVEVSDLSKAENVFDEVPGQDRLLEVYFDASTTDGQSVLVETYYPYSLVTERAERLRARFMPLMIASLVLLTVVQVPLSIRLARRLGRYQRERERLLERVIDASDTERRRIAGEVHDGAVQDLIGITYSLEANAEHAPEPLADSLRGLARSNRTTVRRLRSLLNSIYPVEVPEAGWSSGLDDLVAALANRDVEVKFDIPKVRLTPIDELLLLRITREALRNVATHAGATHVTVRLLGTRGRLVLEVTDDGHGFSKADAASSRSNGHLGLQLMNDLAADVGASLDVESVQGIGTTVRLELVGQR